MMRALEDGVVVELDVRGEAERAPVLHEGVLGLPVEGENTSKSL
jgi:hypothetical protein